MISKNLTVQFITQKQLTVDYVIAKYGSAVFLQKMTCIKFQIYNFAT